ncbi:glutaredoxin domain-containing protein [Propionibacteriaceae bacterium Y1700]|uniref:glutaredoxin domain-containing protein n=1 Tax=Microlunatus sp. Y1700 TaxID=3418487 RepID=UPI003DA7753F
MRGGMLGGAWKVLFVICGLLLIILGIRNGQPLDVAVGVAAIGVALLFTQFFRRWVNRMQARNEPEPNYDAPVVIFWRPGCGYCARLKRELGDAGAKAEWVNVWAHDQGMALVKTHNNGDETVPTVKINGKFHTNPDPVDVQLALAELPD